MRKKWNFLWNWQKDLKTRREHSNQLLWFSAQYEPYNLIWSCLHLSSIFCLIQRSHLEKEASSWESMMSHAEATMTFWTFFQRLIYAFWKKKEERKIVKHVLFLIQMYFHLNILNENSFPSVGIHPGATFPQNMCLHIQNLSLKKTTFSFPNQGIFLIIKELAGLQKQK